MSKYSGPWRYWMALDKNDTVVAYTSDHKLFKLFKKQRRHDLYSFYSFDLESEEVHFLADKLHGLKLVGQVLKTRTEDNKIALIAVAMTSDEMHTVSATHAHYIYSPGKFIKGIPTSKYLFFPEYTEALRTLQVYYLHAAEEGEIMIDQEDPYVRFDELQIFLDLYGETMR